jgi:toxin ParE1/3/4
MRVVRTVLADSDLLEIWLYIAQDNITAADRLLERLEQRCDRLEASPMLGSKRDDLLPGMRYLIEGSYVIFYRIHQDTVEILRVLHGARDFPVLFQQGETE